MAATNGFIAGVEGGSTATKLVLLGADGKLRAEATGLSTNQWDIGLEEMAKRVNGLVKSAKEQAGIEEESPLLAIGLALSGCDSIEAKRNVENEIKRRYPDLAQHYTVVNDTTGSVATACENGGVVLIAGTGSNCEVVHPDQSFHRVGGWSYVIGDEGSGYFVTHYCLKQVFNTEDNFYPSKHDISCVKKIMQDYFQVADRMGMLDHFYTNFEKAKIAGMCKHIAEAAVKGDALCKEAFYVAGKHLGMHVKALVPRIEKELLEVKGGLHIICVGSVWKSWSLLKTGFLEVLASKDGNAVKEFTLLQLTKTAAYGAAYLASKSASNKLSVDFTANAEVFYHHI